jgi:hypothetical protein
MTSVSLWELSAGWLFRSSDGDKTFAELRKQAAAGKARDKLTLMT